MSAPTPARRHRWVAGPTVAARCRHWPSGPSIVVDAHRRHRGPYSGAGDLVRTIVPTARERWPEIIDRHDVGILAVAPELRALVPSQHETLTSLAPGDERTRFYPRARTIRIAHDLAELLVELAAVDEATAEIVVDHADEADATDVELLTVLLRRLDPEAIRLTISTSGQDVTEELAGALREHTDAVMAAEAEDVSDPAPGLDLRALAEAYVERDCVADESYLQAAYEAIPQDERAALHNARAAKLAWHDELSWGLGAIPFHLERGSDVDAARRALLAALEHCVRMGFYQAVLELGERCRRYVDWESDPMGSWLVTAKVTTALAVLERPREAEALYDEACERSSLPSVHMQAAYGRAMLLTRFYTDRERDHRRAKAWVNTAIAIASQMPDAEGRAFNTTFNENGLALIEMHLGDLEKALRLVTSGIERLDREIGPGVQTLHRSVLRYNRAQLLARMGAVENAVAEYTRCIEADPHHSEYWFERAGLHRRLGNVREALDDYKAAMRESPPYPEPYYNRGALRLELGDAEGALADFTYALELDPDLVAAYVNRASILLASGDRDGATRDVAAGLARNPSSADLHCLAGLAAMEAGEPDVARAAFDNALSLDPTLVEALANRAVVLFESGDVESALVDFNRALDIRDDPAVRWNRALAYEHVGRWPEATRDYDQAAALTVDDEERERLVSTAEESRRRADQAPTLSPWRESCPTAHTRG